MIHYDNIRKRSCTGSVVQVRWPPRPILSMLTFMLPALSACSAGCLFHQEKQTPMPPVPSMPLHVDLADEWAWLGTIFEHYAGPVCTSATLRWMDWETAA
jgi:hypothetical protein